MASRRVRYRALLVAAGVGTILLGGGVARAMVDVADNDGARSTSASAPSNATALQRGVGNGTGTVADPISHLTALDLPLPPGDYALASESGVPGNPSDVLAAAALQYPGFVSDRSIVRFLTIGNDTPNNRRSPMPTWVVLTPGVYAPSLGPANQRVDTKMAASYAWVFLDPDGATIGATIIGYRNPGDAPTLPTP